MNKENTNRLKKYLFMISLFFVLVIGPHIIYLYLYDNAIEKPIEGGSVSEGIIGDFPHLNPLISSNDYNKNIISMLYRSLLRYDFTQKKIVGDLADCDIKNLEEIQCFFKDNIYWSDGKKIEGKDILSTYNIIKNSQLNPLISSLLKDTTIEEKPGIIIFKNNSKDISFLNVLMQPIVSKEIIDNIGNKELFGNFNPMGGYYSGPYTIDTVSYDDNLGIQKFILVKNKFYNERKILISKYVFRFFKDINHFIKHKDIVNIFNDDEKVIGDTIPRLDSINYSLNQYVSLFLNEEKIKNNDFRRLLLEKIDAKNIIKTLGNGYLEVSSPFLNINNSKKKITKNENIESLMKTLGYFKKDTLTSGFLEIENNLKSEKQKQIVNPSLKDIPNLKKENFYSEDNIVINGKVDNNLVENIYINNFKINKFKKGDKNYTYTLKLDFKNIKLLENKYDVYYETSTGKQLTESFNIYIEKDKEKLKAKEDSFYLNQIEQNQEAKDLKINEQKRTKLLSLDDKFYYNTNYEKLSLKLYYIDSKKELVETSNVIKNIIQTYGIGVETIPVTLTDISKKIKDNSKDYDMILIGIDLGFFDYNLYPYLHSSQAKGGYNFSNTKNLDLDILLEDLKTKVLSPEDIKIKSSKALEIINSQNIIKTLFKKEKSVLIDKNIKNYKINSIIPSDIGINDAIYKSYVTSEKDINFNEKNLTDFFSFIKKMF